ASEEVSESSSEEQPVDIQTLLLNIVAERTGYPEDVLELDLDLEADLSIDSIKRLEIVGDLSGKVGLDKLDIDKDAALESLAALKTLRAMVEWLSSNTGATTEVPGVAVTSNDTQTASSPSEFEKIALSRYVLSTRHIN